MLSIRRLASYRPKGQGEAGYEAAKSDINGTVANSRW